MSKFTTTSAPLWKGPVISQKLRALRLAQRKVTMKMKVPDEFKPDEFHVCFRSLRSWIPFLWKLRERFSKWFLPLKSYSFVEVRMFNICSQISVVLAARDFENRQLYRFLYFYIWRWLCCAVTPWIFGISPLQSFGSQASFTWNTAYFTWENPNECFLRKEHHFSTRLQEQFGNCTSGKISIPKI